MKSWEDFPDTIVSGRGTDCTPTDPEWAGCELPCVDACFCTSQAHTVPTQENTETTIIMHVPASFHIFAQGANAESTGSGMQCYCRFKHGSVASSIFAKGLPTPHATARFGTSGGCRHMQNGSGETSRIPLGVHVSERSDAGTRFPGEHMEHNNRRGF